MRTQINPWIGNLIFAVGAIASVLIRIPHDKVSRETKSSISRKGNWERFLISLVALGMIVFPVVSLTSILGFADRTQNLPCLVTGASAMLLGLWVFHLSHRDLGRNWSASLEVRESHALVTYGIYKSVRHPMYVAIFLMSAGQFLLIANWIAGSAFFVAFLLMFVSRVHAEEKMMREHFGEQYETYCRETKRLVPGLW